PRRRRSCGTVRWVSSRIPGSRRAPRRAHGRVARRTPRRGSGEGARPPPRRAREALFRPLVPAPSEPIWAIGTGVTATLEQVSTMTNFIRRVLGRFSMTASRVLYGGSVNAENAASLVGDGGVDGFLVGGASLKAESFLATVQAANDCYARKR